MEKLLLISPPDNSQGARDIAGLSILEVLKIVAETNGLALAPVVRWGAITEGHSQLWEGNR